MSLINNELVNKIFISIILAILFLAILYYFTFPQNYRLYLQCNKDKN